jgi:hypothetical protein
MCFGGAWVVLWYSLAQITPAAPTLPPPPPTTSAPSTEPTPVPPPRLPRVSLTFSPLQFSFPASEMGIRRPFFVNELAGELRVHEKVSLMLFAGVGADSGPGAPGIQKVSDTEWHYGFQGRYYLTGNFRRGLPIGAEIYYFQFGSVAVIQQSGDSISGSARGRAVGPFLGYKYTFDHGFTIDGELGWVYVTMTEYDYPNHGGFNPIINLKVGWSF